jgi:hypothetical protein
MVLRQIRILQADETKLRGVRKLPVLPSLRATHASLSGSQQRHENQGARNPHTRPTDAAQK